MIDPQAAAEEMAIDDDFGDHGGSGNDGDFGNDDDSFNTE